MVQSHDENKQTDRILILNLEDRHFEEEIINQMQEIYPKAKVVLLSVPGEF